jgi:hypothetical protein
MSEEDSMNARAAARRRSPEEDDAVNEGTYYGAHPIGCEVE